MDDIYFEEPAYPFFNKIQKCITLFINLSIALLFTFILLRGLEIIYITRTNDLPQDFYRVLIEALIFDVVYFLKIIPFLFLPFFLVFFSTKIKRSNYWAFGILGTLVIITYLILIKYFATALVPLGADLFGYSWTDIKATVASGAKPDAFSVIIFAAALSIFWVLLSVLYNNNFLRPRYAVFLLLAGFLLSYAGVSALPKTTSFKSDFSFNLAVNKAAFFTERSTEYFTANEPEIDIYAMNYLEDDQADNAAGIQRFNYISAEYPFLRKDETPDVLGNFFNIDTAIKPNIVFIQVEGLGRAFSGPNAYLGSFTPFLDQLAAKGLYFENFLASQGRTFASLPSILASLPFAENGFSDLGSRMPKFLSLQNVLQHNGYLNKFYGGFEMGFDNQGLFMKNAGTNVIVGMNEFGNGFTKSPGGATGLSWGYADRELMLKSIQTEASKPQQPFMTYIETISMHTPYVIPGQENYEKLFESRMTRLGFDETKKKSYRQYQNIYSTIVYTDEALKFFFAAYAKLPAYKNTIFIITGDHRLPEIPMATKIDRYHVPLLIYSPLLKKTANFRSVSSHLDITPSLLAFLKKNYRVKTPETVAWVGSGLDTARTFRNIHQYPLKQTKSDLHNYISGLYFLDQDVLFSIGENMNVEPVIDEAKLNELRSGLNQYKAKNDQFKRELRLIPDSLYSAFKK